MNYSGTLNGICIDGAMITFQLAKQYDIVDVNILVENKVVEVTFADGTKRYFAVSCGNNRVEVICRDVFGDFCALNCSQCLSVIAVGND